MPHELETQRLAKRLKGQKLVIPDLKPVFSHWPSCQNEKYTQMRDHVQSKLSLMLPSEKHQKAVNDADPALLAARWWPTSSWERYQVMTDLTIWFGIWDDYMETLENPQDAEAFRVITKEFVAHSFGLPGAESIPSPIPSLIHNFESIGAQLREAYDIEQRRELLRHFNQYIDATRMEREFENSATVPSLDQYWKVRTLTSGMGTLLGMSEYALGVKLPMDIITTTAYDTLWVSTIVINSVVNDLISLKKEMAAGSVLSSVAILFHEVKSLDTAVKLSIQYIQHLVDLYDRTAQTLLEDVAYDPKAHAALSKVIDLFRMVNTGNLEWSLGARRYGMTEFIQQDGSIELYL